MEGDWWLERRWRLVPGRGLYRPFIPPTSEPSAHALLAAAARESRSGPWTPHTYLAWLPSLIKSLVKIPLAVDCAADSSAAVARRKAYFSEEEVRQLQAKLQFQNLVLEGGGAKGIAYIGVMEELQDHALLSRFKRFCGVSMGSVMAALLAVGDSPDRIRTLTSSMDAHVFLDCGWLKYVRLLPNLLFKFGWHPAATFFRQMSEEFRNCGFDADVTFGQLYNATGRELCVVAANISNSTVEYFHPKTTPNFPILQAVAMSIAIPVAIQPRWSDVNGQHCLFVDGGVMNNFPIDCFDGWYLSMKPEHCFLSPNEKDLGPWFQGYNPQTLGAMVFSAEEKEILKEKFKDRLETIPKNQRPKRPNTRLASKRQPHLDDTKKGSRTQASVDAAQKDLAACLKPRSLSAITRDELLAALSALRAGNSANSYRVLFGQRTPEEVVKEVVEFNQQLQGPQLGQRPITKGYKAPDADTVSNHTLASYLASRGKRVHQILQQRQPQDIEDFKGFVLALITSLTFRHKQLSVTDKDFERIIGIHCDYVTTMDDLEEGDIEFLVEQGRMATQAFLKERLKQGL